MSKALVLRVCNSDGTSRNGFKWPLTVGSVATAPDWSEVAECGNGLHGWLYGQGDHTASNIDLLTATWLVVEVDLESVVMLGGKCKFETGVVRFAGDRKSATDYLYEHEPRSRTVAVIGACRADLTDSANVFVGAYGHATSGYGGVLTILHWNGRNFVRKIAAVGENGIEPNVAYKLDDAGKFVKA